jgi:hypothetical protein
MRLLARAPQLLAVTVVVVLALAGLRTVVFGDANKRAGEGRAKAAGPGC